MTGRGGIVVGARHRMARRRRLGVVVLTALLASAVGVLGVGAAQVAAASTYPTTDGQYEAGGPIAAGGSLEFVVTGRGGVPADGAGAVALNLAITNVTAASYLTVWPTGSPRPTAANVNVVPGQTVSNMVIAKIGSGGKVSIFNYAGSVDVIVDVMGWYPAGGEYTGLSPARVLDSRPGYPTVDGLQAGTGVLTGGSTLRLPVAGRGGVPATGAGAVALNVAVTNVTAASYLTVWPTGAGRPTAANMNVAPGQTVSNMVVAKVGADGSISIFDYAGSLDVIVDVMGWFPSGGQFTGLTPARLADTRPGSPTVDGQFAGTGALGANGVLDLTVTGRGGVPSGAGAVVLNVAATNVTSASFLTVWPSGAGRPTAANMNVVGGQTVSNMVIAKVGAGGKVSIFNLAGALDIVVDVLGWFPSGGQYAGLTPARLVDSRGGLPPVTTEPAGAPCSLPGNLAGSLRVQANPQAGQLIDAFSWTSASTAALVQLAHQIFAGLGPMPVRLLDFEDQWMTSQVQARVQQGAVTPDLFVIMLTTAYHESVHELQGLYCLPSGPTSGYKIATSWWSIGPPQSAIYDDVLARIGAIITDETSFCSFAATGTADTYLSPDDPDMSGQGLRSQLWEMNAYTLEMELENVLVASGVALQRNIGVESAKLHQVARYVNAMKAQPGMWATLRSVGADAIVAAHWNLAVQQWRWEDPADHDGHNCWNLAFGPDAGVIAEFTQGAAGMTAPPMPG